MNNNFFMQILLAPYNLLKWLCMKIYAVIAFLFSSFVHIFTLLSVLFFIGYAIWEISHKYHFIKENWNQIKTYIVDTTGKFTQYVRGTYHKIEEDVHKASPEKKTKSAHEQTQQ